jgi:phage repressor protein C with HTH and peptisase S24 domain
MAKKQSVAVDRLAEEMEISGYNGARLAEALGVSAPAISDILTGKTANSRLMPRIADLLGVPIGYLFGTTDEKEHVRDEGFFADAAREMNAVLLQEVDIRYGMGGGGFSSDVLPGAPVAFPREWIRGLLKGGFEKAFIAHATGDSMSPTLADGDVVIIDRSQRHLGDQDSVWCIAFGDLCMIKRVRALPDGSYEIHSDNPSVSPMTAHDGELHIIGRVVWTGRRI